MLFYFIMTALHATHMIVGIGVMTTLMILTRRGHYSREYHTPIEIAGLYWHFVDIVWVFLYPAALPAAAGIGKGFAMAERAHSKNLYIVIYVALLVLLVYLTVGFSFIDLGGKWNDVVAIAIACIKGLLIILFFMQVRVQPWLTWFFAAAGFLWLGIMMTLFLSDYLTRNHPANSSPKGEPVFLATDHPSQVSDRPR